MTEETNQIINVVIKGTRPLLMHSTAGMLVPKSKTIKSSAHDPAEEAKQCLYFNEAGHIAVPSMAILSAMRKASANLKKGGAGKKTLKDFVFSGLRIDPDMIELTPQTYELNTQMVVVMRARIPRVRPLFKNWNISFKIEILDEQTWDAGTVRQVLESAGKYQGILDFRPLYGTFEIESMTCDGREVR